jgi:hypothetical protein
VSGTVRGSQTRGHRGGRGGDGSYRGGYRGGSSSGGGRGGFGRSYGGHSEQRPPSNKKCHLCDKEDHKVHRCWKRFDRNYCEEKSTNAAVLHLMGLIPHMWILLQPTMLLVNLTN